MLSVPANLHDDNNDNNDNSTNVYCTHRNVYNGMDNSVQQFDSIQFRHIMKILKMITANESERGLDITVQDIILAKESVQMR